MWEDSGLGGPENPGDSCGGTGIANTGKGARVTKTKGRINERKRTMLFSVGGIIGTYHRMGTATDCPWDSFSSRGTEPPTRDVHGPRLIVLRLRKRWGYGSWKNNAMGIMTTRKHETTPVHRFQNKRWTSRRRWRQKNSDAPPNVTITIAPVFLILREYPSSSISPRTRPDAQEMESFRSTGVRGRAEDCHQSHTPPLLLGSRLTNGGFVRRILGKCTYVPSTFPGNMWPNSDFDYAGEDRRRTEPPGYLELFHYRDSKKPILRLE
ncbi:hypothetical protein EDB84DRAFT_1442963 [Lactarius hengduanensis]|nr:hypothetical protein EDB84DRAFT_1442963 [Lactarius hengduanensis]